jgi:solute carrier family 27 fatty acid transporter 1/4
MMDEFGYFFFKDRTGDTYRWKGENVSTSEVEASVSNACGLKDAVVYGVEVPGSEGRAGMAAILDPEDSLDLVSFLEGISKSLPPYARPVFVRIVKEMDMTGRRRGGGWIRTRPRTNPPLLSLAFPGTYKMKKLDLQKEGFDVTKVSDKIHFLSGGKYILLDNEVYSKLLAGQMRL